MRQHDIVIPARWLISEAKARIDHPEDLVFDEGSAGARKSLRAMLDAAQMPHTVTIKWDGSPAVIFGRDDDGFTLTDKSGFSSKKIAGTPRSAAELNNMLFMRKPNDPGRQQYAAGIADLFNPLERVLPKEFRGFLQADLLWQGRPRVIDGNYVFTPNKITYSIPVDSDLGQRISTSHAGFTLHTRYDSREDDEGRAIGDINQLGLRDDPKMVIMGPEIRELQHTHISPRLASAMEAAIKSAASSIDSFLDQIGLRANGISDLPDRMKSYIANRASSGKGGLDDAAQDFVRYINEPSTKITSSKRVNMLRWIDSHQAGYMAAWQISAQLLKLKDLIKQDIDRQIMGRGGVEASYQGVAGHEGYVADTPNGKIKFVDRPHFMRKEVS